MWRVREGKRGKWLSKASDEKTRRQILRYSSSAIGQLKCMTCRFMQDEVSARFRASHFRFVTSQALPCNAFNFILLHTSIRDQISFDSRERSSLDYNCSKISRLSI